MQFPPKKSVEKSTEPCPKCGIYPIAGAKECLACGLIFSRWVSQTQGGHVVGSEALERAWLKVLEAWENSEAHEDFIRLSQKVKNLPFASLKYRRILDADPHNQQALQRKEQVIRLVLNDFMLSPQREVRAAPYPKIVFFLIGLGVSLVLLYWLSL